VWEFLQHSEPVMQRKFSQIKNNCVRRRRWCWEKMYHLTRINTSARGKRAAEKKDKSASKQKCRIFVALGIQKEFSLRNCVRSHPATVKIHVD
jgi:hypothetical protein